MRLLCGRRLSAVHTADVFALAWPRDVVIDRIQVPAFGADPARCRRPLHDRTMGTAGFLTTGEEQLLELEWWFVGAHAPIVGTMLRVWHTSDGRGTGRRRRLGISTDDWPSRGRGSDRSSPVRATVTTSPGVQWS